MPSLARRTARREREPARPVPPLPHPSWNREADRIDRKIAVSASEFWNRLGL